MRWQITYRAKKSPYVQGLERRTHTKVTNRPNTITVAGTHLNNRQAVKHFFKEAYPWAIIISLKRIR